MTLQFLNTGHKISQRNATFNSSFTSVWNQVSLPWNSLSLLPGLVNFWFDNHSKFPICRGKNQSRNSRYRCPSIILVATESLFTGMPSLWRAYFFMLSKGTYLLPFPCALSNSLFITPRTWEEFPQAQNLVTGT